MDATVPEVDPQPPLQDNEGLVRVFVVVPDEIALELHDLELIVVHFSDDLRLPLLVEQPEFLLKVDRSVVQDRKSTRLNSSHLGISYAVFCLKKKNKKYKHNTAEQKKRT